MGTLWFQETQSTKMSDDFDYCHIQTKEEDLQMRVDLVMECTNKEGLCFVFHYITETMEMVMCQAQKGQLGG
jgi:hypothetical protein